MTLAADLLHALFNQYYLDRLAYHPMEATMSGIVGYNDRYENDISLEYRKNQREMYIRYLKALDGFDREAFPENDIISYDVLKWICTVSLEQLQFPLHLLPVNQFFSPHLIIGQYATGNGAQPFKSVKDYGDWINRLCGYLVWCDTAIVNMRTGIATGYTIPKILTERMIPQFESFTVLPVEKNLFYTPVKAMPDSISESDKKKIEAEYRNFIATQIVPEFTVFVKFLKEEYLPACRKTSGYGDLPNGVELYRFLIRSHTTTNLTPDEIIEIGQNEVSRIMNEMEKVKKQVGYQGDLVSFFNYVRDKKELMPYRSADEVVKHFEEIHEIIKPNLDKLFDLVPTTGFEIRRTEAFREQTASAEYVQASLDGSRPGIFYVPVPDALKYNIYADEDLFLHEAIPGHHFQVSLQQENNELTDFQKILWDDAFGEGWALYAESLGKELGLYTDPYQYLGMLGGEILRAVRLVVDAGIHSKGWTREQAIKYALEHEAEPEYSIIAEIERYMAGPGQALSYKIGQLKFFELRARAEKELGDKFDIREFHNEVLESGILPLAVLEAKIDRWIDSKL